MGSGCDAGDYIALFASKVNHFIKVRASYCKSMKWSIVLIKNILISYTHAIVCPISGRPREAKLWADGHPPRIFYAAFSRIMREIAAVQSPISIIFGPENNQ
jgi:hypothetical protein